MDALRTRVVPGFEAETRAIALVLEQREREDRFRLKRVKTARALVRPSETPEARPLRYLASRSAP